MSGPPTGRLAALARAWDRFWFAPRSTVSLALFRIAIGLIGTCQLLALLPDALTLFGPGGMLPTAPPGDWSVLSLVNTDAAVITLFGVGLPAALAVTAGWHSRVASILLAVVIHSLLARNPGVWSSGDHLFRTLTLLLALTPSGAALSVDRLRARSGTGSGGFWEFPIRPQWGVRLVQIQLSVAYLASVTHKLRSADWRDGTAVSYALRMGDTVRYAFPDWITQSEPIMRILTWSTLELELMIGVLVWVRVARPFVLAIGVGLHLGMHMAFAFGTFGLAMLSMYLVFIPPPSAERFARGVRDRVIRPLCRGCRRAWGPGARASLSPTPPETPAAHPAPPAAPAAPKPTP